MEMIIITGALLAGWAIRRKSADVLKIRRANQRRRAEVRRDQAHRADSWAQILRV